MLDDADYYRADWMTDDQWECAQMFAKVVGGFHHLMGTYKQHGRGIKIHTSNSGWATFDFDLLTRLVVIGHDQMIRIEILPSGPNMVGFGLWKRHKRDGSMFERHPTIEQAIERIRPSTKGVAA